MKRRKRQSIDRHSVSGHFTSFGARQAAALAAKARAKKARRMRGIEKQTQQRMMKLITILGVLLALVCTGQAEPRKHKRSHNYIIERQEAYQVQGVPTSRLIIGKREIDIYPNGMMFEQNNLVGVRAK